MFTALKDFREQLYKLFTRRQAASLNLIDAVSSHHNLGSVTQLRLSPFFLRKYNSIVKVIDELELNGKRDKGDESTLATNRLKLFNLEGQFIPPLSHRDFYLFGADVTPALRPYARKLSDKGIVYQPNSTPGNKPIAVGHSYSLLGLLPEKKDHAPP